MTEHRAIAIDRAHLRLFGEWQFLVDGVEVVLGHREQRLVALLGLLDRRARGQVASALWPESTDERALASLRRAVLQCHKRCPGLVVAERLTIALDPGVHVDVDDLRRAAGLTRLPMTDLVAHELMTTLCGDELLPGWYDDWVVEERSRLEQLRAEALERVALHGLEQGDAMLALDAARGASEIEPLRELPHEVSIRAHLRRGDAGGAVHEFQRYRAVMHDELGVAPSSRMAALVQPLLAEGPDERSTVTLPRQRTAAPEEDTISDPVADPRIEDWAPTSLDDFLDGRPPGAAGGVRRVAPALVAVAGVVLTVSLAVTLAGPDPSSEVTSDPGRTGATDRLPPSGSSATPGRTVRVLPMDSETGDAVFAVRADQRPAQVRLVVRGPAGLRVVRHLVVRDAAGRDVVVHGLDPGTYTWSATSATASPVSGEVSVSTPAAEARAPDPPAASVTADVTQVAATASAPGQVPTSTPTSTPTSSPTPTQSPPPKPSPSHTPTGTPRDPGAVAPTPVG